MQETTLCEPCNIIVKSKRLCIENNCNKYAYFNIKGEKPKYCSAHKREGMIDVQSKLCAENGCNKRPCFNIDGNSPKYCALHKTEEMINVLNKRCFEEGCKKQPSYNISGELSKYCSEHKKEGMINVLNKMCIEEGCNKFPTYNFKGEKLRKYCTVHKKEGMVDIKSDTCAENGCIKRPIFNNEGEKKPKYCYDHKEEDMIDVLHKLCKTPLCYTRTTNTKYQGYCSYCFIKEFPDAQISLNYKTKELAVADYIIKSFPDHKWISDKKVQGGSSRRRPDLLLDLKDKVIIVEIDENQHTRYDKNYDILRTQQLYSDLQNRPIVFIRFNPDDYIKFGGAKVTSCWSLNKDGICAVKKSKNTEWSDRLTELRKQIEYWYSHDPNSDNMIKIVQLFFDDDM